MTSTSRHTALAAVLGINAERLWRDLWMYPAGEVREMFLSVIERILEEQAQQSLHVGQRARLFAGALRYFSTGRAHDRPDEPRVMVGWRRAIG